ncbi:MAG TPA: protein kinase [Polyangiaceae bacterium]|jgi:serine/threonine-protein kinase|nr:protein kinase [Polyangiaceae bacterium]
MRARDYQPGEQVPGTVYKIVRLIGSGGMGTVYDVEDTTIGKRYVLKTLHPKLGAREDLARRIQNEARTLARLHHPNIVEVITAGITADALHLPYYLMERLNGQSLRVILEKKGRIDLVHAYHVGIDLLDALDHAHDKNVIHRDVKPDNIFLHRTNAGVTLTKLLDFGIVSMLDASDGETGGRFLGTLRYAAPEQLRGERPTPKTDVYAAGLVVYEMIAGRGPFDDEGDANRVAAAHLHKFPMPVSHFVPVPRAVDVLLMASLAKNPDARPRDAFSFAASLRNLKRQAEDVRSLEATEDRVTASVVLGAESSSALPRSAASSSDASDPKSTLVGMPLPTFDPPPGGAGSLAVASATIPDPVNRGATTNTLGPDTIATPMNGTEALVEDASARAGVSLGEASTELQWPLDRAPIRSDEPQVRSLPAIHARRLRARPAALVLVAGLGFGAMAATLVLGAHRAPKAAATDLAPPAETTLPPTAPAPVTASAATMAAPLASALVPAPEASGSTGPNETAPAPSVAPLASAATLLLPAARAKPPAIKPRPQRPAPAPQYASDRPGPGF